MEKLWALLKNVTSEIFETMFFLFIEPPQGEAEAELLAQWQGPGLQTLISITGPQTFSFGLVLPLNLGREMAANFLGAQDTLTDAEVVDVIKECTNMIGGSLLTHLNNAAAYQLSIPQGGLVALDKIPVQGPLRQLLNLDNFPLGLYVNVPR